jgi:hypothetical protein
MKKNKGHTAHVTLTVTRPANFKRVTSGAFTKCAVALSEKTGRVESGPGGNHTVHDCARGPVVFKISIAPKGAYLPAGVAFEHTKASKGSKKMKARHVRDNFPPGKVSLRGGMLEFTDECSAISAGHSFEYYVLIQRKDGALGIIDPGIQHDSF